MIACEPALLCSAAIRTFLPERVVLSINPTGGEASEFLHAAVGLREAGHSLLRSSTSEKSRDWNLPLVASICMAVGPYLPEARQHVLRTSRHPLRLVARDVSTRTDWAFAANAGFRFYQGEYFLKPARTLNREMSPSKVACPALLKELCRPVLELRTIEDLIKSEPSFCYRLFRYLNSAAFFGLEQVTSIRHAMAMLGDDELRRSH